MICIHFGARISRLHGHFTWEGYFFWPLIFFGFFSPWLLLLVASWLLWLRWLRWLLASVASVAFGFLASVAFGFLASVASWLLWLLASVVFACLRFFLDLLALALFGP